MHRTGLFSGKNVSDSELTDNQKLGMSKGYTLSQVSTPWFTFDHIWLLTKNFRPEDIAELHQLQLTGLEKGLTLNQVKQLSEAQLQGVAIGLTYDQVNHSWFTHSHAGAVMEGIIYNDIMNMTSQEVEIKREELRKIEQDGIMIDSQLEEAMKEFSLSQK